MSMEDKKITDVLIHELDFNNVRTSNYILQRNEAIFNVTGSSTYSPNTQTQAVITLNTDTILDPSTLRLNMKITNTDPTAADVLRLLGGAHVLIKRIRLLGKNGIVIHDYQDYGRYIEQLLLMESKGAVCNYNTMANNGNSVNHLYNEVNFPNLANTYVNLIENYDSKIAGNNASMNVSIPIKIGLFQQSKYLLMRYLSTLSVEITFDNTATNCVLEGAMAGTSKNPLGTHSTSYSISDINISVDSLILDSDFMNQFDSKLLNGESINYIIDNVYHQNQSTGGSTNLSLNLSRNFADLNSIYVSFYDANSTNGDDKACFRRCNCFTKYEGTTKKKFSYNFSINGKYLPSQLISNPCSQFFQLLKSIGLNNQTFHSTLVNYKTFNESNFIMAYDFDRALLIAESGENLLNSNLQLNLKSFNDSTGAASAMPAEVYILMNAKSKLVVKATSIDVLD